MTAEQLLRTLQFNDSLFPTGGFAYSDGLETAIANGLIQDAASLRKWLDHYVKSVFIPCDGLALLRAMTAFSSGDWDTLALLDSELTAMKPAAEMRAASAALGKRFLKSVAGCYPHPDLVRVEKELHNLPVIYGIVYSTLRIESHDTLLSFSYTRLAGMISAALRLMPIGQDQAQAVFSRVLETVPSAVQRICDTANEELTCFAPILDIQQMNHHSLYSRLFRT